MKTMSSIKCLSCWLVGWFLSFRYVTSSCFGASVFSTFNLVKRFNVLQRISLKKLVMSLSLILILIFTVVMNSTIFSKEPAILTCLYINTEDALVSTEAVEFMPPAGSIFFHETLCRGRLNSRQACSVVESAARIHPDREVYVLFPGPVTNYTLKHTILAKLQEIPNVHFARIHIEEYAKRTPLETLVARGNLLSNSSPVEYISNILRFLTLSKWSGIYLDMDMLVAKDFGPLGPNWIACEDHLRVNSAAIAISRDVIGLNISKQIMQEIANSYTPRNLSWSEPDAVMMRVLRQRCSSSDVYEWSNSSCGGFEVWAPSFVFPVHYTHSADYFKVNATMGDILTMSTYAYHLWNKRTRHLRVIKDSLYDNLAKKFCPAVYNTNLLYSFNDAH